MLFKNTLVIHHTAISQKVVEQFERVNQAHIRRGFGKIGYHFFIGTEGTIKQGRNLWENGAHTKFSLKNPKSWKVNSTTFGIVLAGNFELEEPRMVQIEALKKLIKDIEKKYGKCKIYPHQYYSWTLCCGKNLIPWLKNINVDNSIEARKERRPKLPQSVIDKIKSLIFKK